jgi:hypothetical protein
MGEEGVTHMRPHRELARETLMAECKIALRNLATDLEESYRSTGCEETLEKILSLRDLANRIEEDLNGRESPSNGGRNKCSSDQ